MCIRDSYSVGDMWYGKNGIDLNNTVFTNTSGFTSKFFHDKLRVKGDFNFKNTNSTTTTTRVPVPYSITPNVTTYVGTATNDIQNDWQPVSYTHLTLPAKRIV